MIMLWRSAGKSLKARMGGAGNFMSFGNSGARIYAESQIKTTFADVAGQEEAKDALMEIVDSCTIPENTGLSGPRSPKEPCS